MRLAELQREFFELVRQPLTRAERTRAGARARAERLIRPSAELGALERLEIYNRAYWFRILASLAEDFPGLRAVLGQRRFDRLLRAYLGARPSESFSLRDLGARLPAWLEEHPEPGAERLALDMARLEWADIEAYDGAELPRLDPASLGEDPVLRLQPHLQLLELAYPVDAFLLKLRQREGTRSPRKPAPEAVHLAVHRQEDEVYYKRLEPASFALLSALRAGLPLSEALARLPEPDPAELQAGFAHWASLGWFC